MGGCMSAQRVADTESASSSSSRMKAILPRVPSTTKTTQDHRPGCPATAVTSSPALQPAPEVQHHLLLPTSTMTFTAVGQPAQAASAITAAICTPLALDPTPQTRSAEPQGSTAPTAGCSAAQDIHEAAGAPGPLDCRPTATATITVNPPSTSKIKNPPGKISAQALELSRHSLVPLTLAWIVAERRCIVLKDLCTRLHQRLRKEQADKLTVIGDLAASAELAADLSCQLSTLQESHQALEDELRGKDHALAAAVAQADCLRRELDEQRGQTEDTQCQLRASQAQLAQQERWITAAQAQMAEQDCQLRAAQAQVAEKERHLSAAQAQLAQQEARLSLLPKTMARATELSQRLAAAESAAADATAKLKAERIKGVRLAWLLRKTEDFAETLESLHDHLPHLDEDDLTTVGVLGKGGYARVDHKTVRRADGSTADVAVKVVLPPVQPGAAADRSPDAAHASSDDDSDSDASSVSGSAASSAGDSAPAAACSLAPETCNSSEDEEQDSDSDDDTESESESSEGEEDDSSGSDSDSEEDEEEDADEMELTEEMLRQSLKSRALRLEGAVLNKLRGLPCILSAQAWQGRGRTGLVLPLAKGGSLQELLWPVSGDRSIYVPQDRELVLRICGGLCTALQAAHEAGVAHLDVKADNVLLDADFNVQLADWGTAAPLSFTAPQWRARGVLGSLGLIFPRVLYNPASGGVRADVFATGALCYGLLTGRDYAHECWDQYAALPKAALEAIKEEAAECCDKLGCSVGPTNYELLMVAQHRGHVCAERVGQNLQLLGGASSPEPLGPLMFWTQRALSMDAWRDCEVTLEQLKSAVVESWQRLHAVA